MQMHNVTIATCYATFLLRKLKNDQLKEERNSFIMAVKKFSDAQIVLLGQKYNAGLTSVSVKKVGIG